MYFRFLKRNARIPTKVSFFVVEVVDDLELLFNVE